MDQISGLPNDLLVKILSYVPTKVAVSTCILSKRWEFVWMWLPKLEFINKYLFKRPKHILKEFIDKKLPLHRAPVIESLRLDLCYTPHIKHNDIKRWIAIAVSRYVRELEIVSFPGNKNIFPSNLSTCKSLVTLKLGRMTLMDVPSMIYLPSMKTLQLDNVTFVYEKCLQQLLSVCPLLEDLSVHCVLNNMKEFSIIVPSLKSLSLYVHKYLSLYGYVIDTPSLKYFKLLASHETTETNRS